MKLQPGDIYEGPITSFGHEGEQSRWIVISPFGKTHLHSIDNPFHLHCMPLAIAEQAVDEGRLKLVEQDANHPVMELQHEKERLGISDSHLGLRGEQLKKMLTLMRDAAEENRTYFPYAVGELLSFVNIHQNDTVRGYVFSEIESVMNNRSDLPGAIPAHLMAIPAVSPFDLYDVV